MFILDVHNVTRTGETNEHYRIPGLVKAKTLRAEGWSLPNPTADLCSSGSPTIRPKLVSNFATSAEACKQKSTWLGGFQLDSSSRSCLYAAASRFEFAVLFSLLCFGWFMNVMTVFCSRNL